MTIYLIPFMICLAIAMVPCVIQLLVCLATDKPRIRLIPVVITSCIMLVWAYYIVDGNFRFPYLGNAVGWVLWQSMAAALIFGHGLPFLILGWKK